MENKIKTAEEFIDEYLLKNNREIQDIGYWDIEEIMIEFAKYHVERALENACKNSKLQLQTYYGDMEDITEEAKVFWGSNDPNGCYSTNVKVNKDSILNSYLENNIK